MNKEMSNIIAIQSFKDGIKKKKSFGEGIKFRGNIEYEVHNHGRTYHETLDVFLTTSFETEVKLDINNKAKTLTDELFHLDFNPKFSNMTFKHLQEGNILVIEGKKSPKLGDYCVIITEA